MIRAIVVTVLLCFAAWAALAHDHGPGSWINQQNLRDPVTHEPCCNLHDCTEELGGIRETAQGYLIIATGEEFPRERVIWKSPGGWWRCQYLGGPNTSRTRCLIGPPPSG